MTRKQNQIFIGVVVVVAILAAMWPIYNKYRRVKNVDATLHGRAKALVEKNRQLQPTWDAAMQDNVLTWDEAKTIIEGAGEKLP